MPLLAALPAVLVNPADTGLTLRTQFDESIAVLPPAGVPLVLVYSDRAGAAQAPGWLRLVKGTPCRVLEAANLQGVPAVARGFVGRAFRSSPPILMDWRGQIAAALGFQANAANVYLVEVDGRLRAHLHGALPAEDEASFRAQLRAHCGAAAPQPADPQR